MLTPKLETFQSKFLMDKVTRASRRDDFIGAMYSITHFYLPLPWYSKVLDKDEAIAYRQEYGKFYIITRAWSPSLGP